MPGVLKGVTGIIDALRKTIDETFTSDEERLKFAAPINEIRSQLMLIDAQSASKFQSWWRPALGWVGTFAAAMYYIPQYALASYLWYVQCIAEGKLLEYPIGSNGLIELLGFVSVGVAYRTYERKHGKGKN